MKIAVSLVIDVDPEAWANTYGSFVDAEGNFTLADLRKNVRDYVLNLVQCSAGVDESGAIVTMRGAR